MNLKETVPAYKIPLPIQDRYILSLDFVLSA